MKSTKRTVAGMVMAGVAATALLGASSLRATDYAWGNASGGSWATAADWNPDGIPNAGTDTASLGNLGAAYTVTLGDTRTVGGLTVSGADPTLTVNGTLIQSGGSSTISGGTLDGSGTVRLQNGAAVTWSSATAPGGSLTWHLPVAGSLSTPPLATLDNSTGNWGIASGQTLRIDGEWATNTNDRVFAVSNSFTNAGTIQLGSYPIAGWGYPAPDITVSIASGTLTNAATGQIVLYPRCSDGSGAQQNWSERYLSLELHNDGTLTSYAVLNTAVGRSGANHVNDGTIAADGSLTGSGNSGALTFTGTSFTNNGVLALNTTNSVFNIRVPTFDYNSGGSITGGGTLRLGTGGATDVVNWNGPDPAGAVTFYINTDSRLTLNRTSAWNILSGQKLEFEPNAGASVTQLTVAQNVNNSGTLQMGRYTAGGDYPAVHRLVVSSGKFTNNPGGVINTYPRSATNFGTTNGGYTWSTRQIAGEVDNQGQFNVYCWDTRIGVAGAANTNSGTVTLDSFVTKAAGGYAELIVTGASFTNQAAGTLRGDGILDVLGTTSQTLDNYGTLAPGLSIGTLTIQGDLVMHPGSVLDYEFGPGTTSDLIAVAGDLTVDGTVQVDGGFIMGETYTIFTVTGAFVNNGLTVPGYGRTVVERVGNNITLMAIPEPGTAALAALAGLFALRRRRVA
ncbi:MAG: hypothetical protein BWZ02_01010 [Lentisphaerae bacterium ADurb.BinA184]|nr:MAG: hypothetical protein BWZ02_01010 [Lentisphaerae bacterium ADurb.BinA184]